MAYKKQSFVHDTALWPGLICMAQLEHWGKDCIWFTIRLHSAVGGVQSPFVYKEKSDS